MDTPIFDELADTHLTIWPANWVSVEHPETPSTGAFWRRLLHDETRLHNRGAHQA